VRRSAGSVLLAALCAVWPFAAHAQSGFKGEFDLQGGATRNSADSIDAALDWRSHRDQDVWLRLMWTGELVEGWNLDAAYLAETRHGGGVALARERNRQYASLYVDPDRTALLRLDHTLTDDGERYASQRLDRLAVTYSSPDLVLRLGRQALTWGGGLVFHPMDLFNPFPPNATYTSYKPGADMLYGQWLFDSGADVQAVIAPRRNPETGHVAANQSSAGVKWRGFVGAERQFGADVMLAQDYRAQVLGVALNGPLHGATWTAEVIPTHERDGRTSTSLLANLQYAWSWGERNVNGYAEYFRNGFGMPGDDHTLVDLPVALSQRLARGELFTVSRNYLALGVDLQWTPLLLLKQSLLINLDDGSAMLLGQAQYSLSQDTAITAGYQWAAGSRGTEYGGLETAPGSGVFAVPGNQLYARFTWYFQ
jgi:hypothetical protein